MSNIQNVKTILEEDLLPELESNLTELASITQSWKATEDDKEEFEDLKEMKQFFDKVLEDINNNNLNENDASEMLEVLDEMRLDK